MKNSRVDVHSIEAEIGRLDDLVCKGLSHLKVVYAQMCRAERELTVFLKHYYAQVGHFFEQLQQVRRQPLASAKFVVEKDATLEQTTRQMYHRLVRQYHPDHGDPRGSHTRTLQLVNQAYAKRYVPALYEMEHLLDAHALRDAAPELRLQRTQTGLGVVRSLIQRISARLHALHLSQAWQLKQKLENNPLLINNIIGWVQKQVA